MQLQSSHSGFNSWCLRFKNLPKPITEPPLLNLLHFALIFKLLSNHSNWYDPFLVIYVIAFLNKFSTVYEMRQSHLVVCYSPLMNSIFSSTLMLMHVPVCMHACTHVHVCSPIWIFGKWEGKEKKRENTKVCCLVVKKNGEKKKPWWAFVYLGFLQFLYDGVKEIGEKRWNAIY